jgi:HPt (histidine-containing phosphotransfer) domain-containing protein
MSEKQLMGQGVTEPTTNPWNGDAQGPPGPDSATATASPAPAVMPTSKNQTSADHLQCCDDPDSCPFDYDELLDRCQGNLAFVERILGKFESQFSDEIVKLEQSHKDNDAEEVSQLAHRLKGAAATISASNLADISARIETLADSHQLHEIPEYLVVLHKEWGRFLDFSRSFRRNIATD